MMLPTSLVKNVEAKYYTLFHNLKVLELCLLEHEAPNNSQNL